MHPIEINHSKEPLRLFQSNFLEFFTHIHPLVIVLIWGPVGIYLLVRTWLDHPAGASLVYIPLLFILGLFLWTFAEYTLHRFVFHYRPRNAWQEKIVFLFHGIHHAQPRDKTRLVMPPVVSIPGGVIFSGLFHLIVVRLMNHPEWLPPLLFGFLLGYLTYDLTHYAVHHFPMRRGFLKMLKRHHIQHHYKTPHQRFGVSSPLWDLVFHTYGE